MSVIATSGVDGDDEDLMMSQKLWDKVREKGFNHVDTESEGDESESDEEESEVDSDDSDDSVDSKAEHIERMADEFENQIK